jgi:trehalose 6-phosphate phosphatase
MRHLFSPEGERALAEAMRRSPLLLFDFDGTLAPIVLKPADARIPPRLLHLLVRLADVRPIGIVTGRSVDDVTYRLGFTPHHIIGNHGAEDPKGILPAGDASLLDPMRRRIAEQALDLLEHGIEIEDKRYSLALHFRSARNPLDARERIEALLHELDPRLTSFGGKYVVNIVATEAPDKADAVLSLLQRSQAECAVYVGDDVNDEAVFVCAPAGWLTVRIGRDDTPSAAAFFLNDHAEMATLLEKMLRYASKSQ